MTRGELFYDDPVTRLPVLFLWPHSGCNARCVMCDIWQDRSRRQIDPEDVERWADGWVELGVRFVILTGGEALMHSNLWQICAALRQRSIDVSLLSTGITLRKHAAAVVEHCNGVTVSLDGPPAVHDKVRRVKHAHRLLQEGVAAVRAINPKFRVFGRCAVHRHNWRHLREVVRFAKEIGLDRISFLGADVTSEAFNRPDGWEPDRQQDIAIPADDLPGLAEELDALEREHAADFHSGFINEPPEKLRANLLTYYQAHHGVGDFAPVECNAPWASALIEVDGTVRPCFFQPAYGNIHEAGSLEAVINSPTAVAFRRNLDMRTDPICRRCVCTFAVRRCVCGLSRAKPNCDNVCVLLDALNRAAAPALPKSE